MTPSEPLAVQTFATELGWMALVGTGDVLCRLTFGHNTPAAALAALGPAVDDYKPRTWNPELARRLKAFAAGARDDFRDIALALGPQTDFQRRVIAECRRIGYGRTLSYAELASRAGRPRAARAVGNCMRSNQVPLVIPCHRVIGSSGSLGGYSAPDGLDMKRRLLELEGHEEPALVGGLALAH